jgi:hypothetical protein
MNVELQLDGKQVIVPKFKLFKNQTLYLLAIENLSIKEIDLLNNKIIEKSKLQIKNNSIYLILFQFYFNSALIHPMFYSYNANN